MDSVWNPGENFACQAHGQLDVKSEIPLHQRDKLEGSRGSYSGHWRQSGSGQAHAKKQILFLKRNNAIPQSFSSPIAIVPNEILSHIFQEYVSLGHSAWLLTNVSERWKQVAIRTPLLWGSITLQDRLTRGDKYGVSHIVACGRKRHFAGQRSICFEETELGTFLRYSGATLLDIVVKCSPEQGVLRENIVANLKQLTNPEIMKRIELLDIEVWNEGYQQIPSVLEGFQSAPLLNLRILCISRGMSQQWKDDLLRAVSSSSMKLTTLKTNAYITAIASLSDEAWGRIKSLELSRWDRPVDLDQNIQKISAVEKLENIPLCWPSHLTPRCTFQNLQAVRLYTMPRGFRQIEWPSIKELYIMEPCSTEANDSGADLEFINLPMLTTMRLRRSRDPQLWFSKVSMPSLSYLYLEISAETFKVPYLMAFTALRTLKVRSRANDRAFVHWLDLPNLEKITIVPLAEDHMGIYPLPQIHPDTYGLQLVPYLNRSVHRLHRCPNLREVVLGSADAKISTPKRSLVPSINRLVSARKILGYPLEKVEVWWAGVGRSQVFSGMTQ
ncbi:hypothetical protein CPB86DRAFT_875471 [Serendipita vermifera]|nr:hypothetical protein CPB86DRAFT_875471 [Serendipita vermifera]